MMIYITQLIFVKEGKENTFLEFEEHAIPLMEKYNGRIIYRLRPSKDSFISEKKELPYEIHFISFDSEKDLSNFMKDDSRLKFIHLKNESIKSTLLIKGEKI
jgi:antibiotic biosynthesis monooxygenase (ABM) superfamily enzyme